MSYSRTTWANGATALSAEHMNNIEDGINEALTAAQGNSDMWSYIRNLVYPVGSIYMTASLDTVAKVEAALGGTWVKWGQGKVPVGVDTSDTDFDTVEETGGVKDAIIPSHDHTASFSGNSVAAHHHTYAKAGSSTGNHTLTISEMPSHNHNNKTISGWLDLRRWGKSGSMVVANGGIVSVMSKTANANGTGIINENDQTVQTVAINASHTHDSQGGGNGHNHSISTTSTNSGDAGGFTPQGTVTVASKGESVTGKNLQPYITCFMYKRTA